MSSGSASPCGPVVIGGRGGTKPYKGLGGGGGVLLQGCEKGRIPAPAFHEHTQHDSSTAVRKGGARWSLLVAPGCAQGRCTGNCASVPVFQNYTVLPCKYVRTRLSP